MAKEYTVNLDGTARPLRYLLEDREAVEALFPKPDGTPGSMNMLVAGHLEQRGSIKVQIALLWTGLRHLGDGWGIANVTEKVQAYVSGGGKMADINRAVYRAILGQGVCGLTVDVDSDEGKGQSPEA